MTLPSGQNGNRFYEFDGFRVDAQNRLLFKFGEMVPLTAKVFDILLLLVQNPGRVLDKKELMDAVWPDSFVEEGNLARNISTLRRVLGESPTEHRYIVTLAGRGYSFVAPVSEVENPGSLLIRETVSAQVVDEEEVEIGDDERPHSRERASVHELLANEQAVIRRNTLEQSDDPHRLRNRWRIGFVGVVCLVIGVAIGVGLYALFIRRPPTKGSNSTDIVRLTTDGKVSVAAISPDGKFFAYVQNEPGRQSLWLKQVASAETLSLLPPGEPQLDGLTFSRDGNYLYFVSIERGRSSGTLFEISPLGGTARKVLDDVWRSPVSFSPDGQRLAFIRDSPDTMQSAIMVAGADGQNQQELTVRRMPDRFGRLAWSPDGKVIACSLRTKDDSGAIERIVTISVTGGQTVASSPQRWTMIGHLKWLSDMSGLIVTARDQVASLPFQIWLLPFPDGVARRLTTDFSGYVSLSLTADSSRILTVQSTRISNIWIVPVGDVTRSARITSGSSRYPGFSFTNDDRMVYASQTSGNLDIWSMKADGTDPRRLTYDPHSDWFPVASPDGRYIVFASDRTGTPHLWRINLDGSDPVQLTFGAGEDRASFSADGAWVVYSSGDENSVLWRVPIYGGSPIQITNKNMTHPVVSPDGQLIAANYRDEPSGKWRVAVIPFEGGEPRQLLDFPLTVDGLPPVRWSSDSQALIFINTVDNISNLMRQPLDGGSPTKITNFQSERIYSFTTSRDGKVIACSRGSGFSDVVMISNFR